MSLKKLSFVPWIALMSIAIHTSANAQDVLGKCTIADKEAQEAQEALIVKAKKEGKMRFPRDESLIFYLVTGKPSDLSLLKAYFAKGGNPNLCGLDGASLLTHVALTDGVPEVELVLKNGASVDAPLNETGSTALLYALWMGRHEVAKVLLDHGANPLVKDVDGRTALSYLAVAAPRDKASPFNLQIELAKYFIEHGVDVNADANTGSPSSLISAVSRDNLPFITLLLEKGANPNIKTKTGRTPLLIAKERGQQEIVDLLKRHGATE